MQPDQKNLQQIVRHTFVAQVEHHQELGSTNDLARQYAQNGADRQLPLLILADRQTAGRGRGANRWWTGDGSLAFSLLLPAEMIPDAQTRPPMIGLAAAVAVADAVAPLLRDAHCGAGFQPASFHPTPCSQDDHPTNRKENYHSPLSDHTVTVHWPNDVYVGEKKLSGILIEVFADRRHIVGIGLNANNSTAEAPEELRQKVVTLRDLLGRPVDRMELLTTIIRCLPEQLETLPHHPQQVARRANQLCGQTGQTLTLKTGTQTITGRCLGIAEDGGLTLETDAGQKVFYTGTLH